MKLEFFRINRDDFYNSRVFIAAFKESFEAGVIYCESNGLNVDMDKELGVLKITSKHLSHSCFYAEVKVIEDVKPVQTSLFSYSTYGDYRGTLQIVAENLACANTALVHFLDEEEMGQADPPMTADDWTLNFVVPVGGDIKRIDGDVTIAQGESVVLDYDWILNEQ